MFCRFLLFSFLFITLSCSDHPKGGSEKIDNGESVIKIDINQKQNIGGYQSIINSVDTILLEENDDLIVGQIDKVILTDHHIFVLDSKKARDVFMYHTDGSFIRSIGNIGVGVGEYLSPNGFVLILKITKLLF